MAELVARRHVQHARLVAGQFGFAVVCVGADDHAVADLGLVCRGAVHRDHLRAVLGADRIGGEALAVVDVVDLDLFVLADSGEVQPIAVDGAGAFVVEDGMGDFGAMQLGFEHDGVHGATPIGSAGGGRVWRVRGERSSPREPGARHVSIEVD